MSSAQDEIDAALEGLRALVRKAVREEQLRDGLTGLANDTALVEWLQDTLAGGGGFWVAFIEVDQFKSVNERFGYDAADDLLRAIGRAIRSAAQDYFATVVVPFRAHGDEFFVAGTGDCDEVPEALDAIRANVAALRIASGDGASMTCTVSVGWATREDCWEHMETLDHRSVRACLERAVDVAKAERNRVIRLRPDMVHTNTVSGRADCGQCRARFDVRLPDNHGGTDALFCPNCGNRVGRPPGLGGA